MRLVKLPLEVVKRQYKLVKRLLSAQKDVRGVIGT